MVKTKKHFRWAILAIVITLLFGGLFVIIQQTLRLAANEPQSAMAKDVAQSIKSGQKPEDLVKGNIDIASSSAPFIIVYDQYGIPIASNGYLDNSIPQVPIGVLAASKGGKTNSVTWQPQDKVRIASVSVQGGTFYVLGGRSLTVTENKISTAGKLILGVWLSVMIVLVLMHHFLTRKKKNSS